MRNEIKNYIGLNINYICTSRKLKKIEFGEIFNIKSTTLTSYTNGVSNPPLDIIQRICAHFKITLDDFINEDMQQKQYADLSPATHKIAEPPAEYVTQKDKTILAQEKTIATLEKQVALLEKTVDSLEAKLAKKAS